MPIPANALFRAAGLVVEGTVPWATRPAEKCPGVYAISLAADPGRNAPLLTTAPICHRTIAAWIKGVPTLRLDNCPSPTVSDVAEALSGLWLADESVLYIGKATSLRSRVGQFFEHELGKARPHKGGHWIKTLANINDLHVHFCSRPSVRDAEIAESALLKAFVAQVSTHSRRLLGTIPPIPFANRRFPGCAKRCRITGDVV